MSAALKRGLSGSPSPLKGMGKALMFPPNSVAVSASRVMCAPMRTSAERAKKAVMSTSSRSSSSSSVSASGGQSAMNCAYSSYSA